MHGREAFVARFELLVEASDAAALVQGLSAIVSLCMGGMSNQRRFLVNIVPREISRGTLLA